MLCIKVSKHLYFENLNMQYFSLYEIFGVVVMFNNCKIYK